MNYVPKFSFLWFICQSVLVCQSILCQPYWLLTNVWVDVGQELTTYGSVGHRVSIEMSIEWQSSVDRVLSNVDWDVIQNGHQVLIEGQWWASSDTWLQMLLVHKILIYKGTRYLTMSESCCSPCSSSLMDISTVTTSAYFKLFVVPVLFTGDSYSRYDGGTAKISMSEPAS